MLHLVFQSCRESNPPSDLAGSQEENTNDIKPRYFVQDSSSLTYELGDPQIVLATFSLAEFIEVASLLSLPIDDPTKVDHPCGEQPWLRWTSLR